MTLATVSLVDGPTGWEWPDIEFDATPRKGDKLEFKGDMAPEGWRIRTLLVEEVVWSAGGGVWIACVPATDDELNETIDDALPKGTQ